MTTTPYGIIHFFAGGTQAQYDASVAAVHPAPDVLPAGQIYHVAGPSEGGFTIVAVHDSQASWERFRDDVLLPRLQAGIEGGFTAPPVETAFPATSLVTLTGRQIVLT